jgi:hypothetical protein
MKEEGIFVTEPSRYNSFYTEWEQVCKFNYVVPIGITHSKQLCFRKPARNVYTKKSLPFFEQKAFKINLLGII